MQYVMCGVLTKAWDAAHTSHYKDKRAVSLQADHVCAQQDRTAHSSPKSKGFGSASWDDTGWQKRRVEIHVDRMEEAVCTHNLKAVVGILSNKHLSQKKTTTTTLIIHSADITRWSQVDFFHFLGFLQLIPALMHRLFQRENSPLSELGCRFGDMATPRRAGTPGDLSLR